MPKIKYMGSSHEHSLEKGENIGGRVQDEAVLGSRLVFNQENNWIIDTEEAGLHDDFVSALLEADPESFQDITGKTRVPSNLNERIFLGHKKSVAADDTPNLVADGGEVQPGGSAVGDGTAGTAAVGGSTAGDGSTATAATARTGGRGRATGGSTTGD